MVDARIIYPLYEDDNSKLMRILSVEENATTVNGSDFSFIKPAMWSALVTAAGSEQQLITDLGITIVQDLR
jgi:hypothetical protein